MDANYSVLESQFSKPTSSSSAGLVRDGYGDFFSFSTGRRNVASLHSVLALLPRQDLGVVAYRFAWGLIDLTTRYEDELELDFKLLPNPAATGFVWGVVAKDCLSTVKKYRWDLTLARTSENPILGNNNFCVMSGELLHTVIQDGNFILRFQSMRMLPSRSSRIQRSLLPSTTPLSRHTSSRSLFVPIPLFDANELIYPFIDQITDQPRDRPALPVPAELRSRHLIVSLRLPPSSDAGATAPLIKACLALIDQLEAPGKITFKPETRTKLRKTREEVDESLRREAEAEKREEAEEEKAREKKRKEEERLNRLSAADQKKELEKERKRALRKVQGKVVKK